MHRTALQRIAVATGIAATTMCNAIAAPAPDPLASPSTAVVAVVAVPRPWYAPRFVVVSKMRDTIPQYERLPGLIYKAFTLTRDGDRYGGIYLWSDRASAEAWFDRAWFARVEKERGAKGEVRYFDAPLVLDNTGGAPAPGDGHAVSTLVTIRTPAGVGRERLVAEFNASLPTYRKVDGLLRKYFIVTDDGRFGGVYVWRSEADAERWFDAAWHERVRRSYGEDAAIEWFDAPILLPTKLSAAAPAS